MNHDRGCPCGREKWNYGSCLVADCLKKPFKQQQTKKENTMSDRLPKHILSEIKEALSSAKMERASFDSMNKEGVTIKEGKGKPEHHASLTEFIKERTRLYRDSWIVARLERILRWSAATDDGSMAEHDILGRLRSPLPNPAVLEEAHKEITKLRERVSDLEAFKYRVEDSVAKLAKDVGE